MRRACLASTGSHTGGAEGDGFGNFCEFSTFKPGILQPRVKFRFFRKHVRGVAKIRYHTIFFARGALSIRPHCKAMDVAHYELANGSRVCGCCAYRQDTLSVIIGSPCLEFCVLIFCARFRFKRNIKLSGVHLRAYRLKTMSQRLAEEHNPALRTSLRAQ